MEAQRIKREMFEDIRRATWFGGGREEQWVDRPKADLKLGDTVLPTDRLCDHLWSLYPACEVGVAQSGPKLWGLLLG